MLLTNSTDLLGMLLVNARQPPMSHEPPTPPADLSIDLLDTLNGCSSEKLQGIAGYAGKVSKHKTESDEDEIGEELSDLPDKCMSSAHTTRRV